MLRLLPVLLALLVATPSFAQDAITPGHSDMDTSLLDEGEMLFSISIKRGPMEQTIGSLTASLTIDEDAGQIKAIRAYEMMGQKLADTTVAAWPSLASISHVSNNPERSLRFSVADGMITGVHTPSGSDAEAFEMSVDGPFFDASWMSLIASLLPLADGYSTTVAAYEYEQGGVADYTLSVSGPVDIELPNGRKYEAWEVQSDQPDGDGATYYMHTANHQMLRAVFRPEPGLEVFIDAEMGEGK